MQMFYVFFCSIQLAQLRWMESLLETERDKMKNLEKNLVQSEDELAHVRNEFEESRKREKNASEWIVCLFKQ